MVGLSSQLRVVSHQQHRQVPALPGGPQRFHDSLRGRRVQLAGQLIGKEQFGIIGKRHGDRHPLRFASRQLAWQVMKALSEADLR